MKEMEDNYLWDRSGSPDPEVQELEEILGTLRYQPRPLEIPNHVAVQRRRSFFPAIAIAAAIALFAIILGLWFGFNRRQAPVFEARHDSQIDLNRNSAPPQVTPDNQASRDQAEVNTPKPKGIQRHEPYRRLLAANKSRNTRTQIRQPELTAQELAEKEQVLTALRLVSVKLNLAQRKTQGAPQLNMIRNQHKIG
jgi:hypothetical protein